MIPIRRSTAKQWFGRKRVGWGWRPIAWQGWLVSLLLSALAVGALAFFRKTPAGIGALLGILAAYVLIVRMTGTTRSEPHPPTGEDVSRGGTGADRSGRSSALPDSMPMLPAQANQAPDAELETSLAPELNRHAREARPAAPPALIVNHLTKRFGERTAFEDVSFTVHTGEVFGFLGPNGAGKTTMVRTLGTLLAPTSGSAEVAGVRLSSENGVEIRRRISIMPEAPGLYLRLTVAENLEFFAGLYGLRDARSRIDIALDAVDLSTRARDSAGSLSKGLRQRVALARALLNDPAIIFLDEPTSGLDPVATREVEDLINGLRQRGVTVFLTTHRLEEAERLCDRVAILNTTLRTVGRTDELRQKLFSKSIEVRTAAPLSTPDAVFSPITAVKSWRSDETGSYVLTVSDPRTAAPEVIRALVAADADVLSIAESRHTLEDVYLELIGEDSEVHSP